MSIKITSNADMVTKKMRKAVSKASGEVPIEEIFNDSFMSKCTRFLSFQALIDESQISVETIEDLYSPEFDQFIVQNTKFSSFEEMAKSASAELMKRNLEKQGIKCE